MASVLAESGPLSQPSFSFIKPNPVDALADSRSVVVEKEAGESKVPVDGPKSETWRIGLQTWSLQHSVKK